MASDPVAIAVLQNRLNAIAEEMGEAMLRTSYSQILNSSRDFSIAIVDRQCRLIAQADHIPVHVGAMPWAARATAEAFPAPQPGDVYLLNDPYHGGSHLPDLTALVPVFDAVNIPFVAQFIGADGVLNANAPMETAATAMLDELLRWTAPLSALRS